MNRGSRVTPTFQSASAGWKTGATGTTQVPGPNAGAKTRSGYLPTATAVAGGGYSADKFSVGPEGGQVLVEETVKGLNELWP